MKKLRKDEAKPKYSVWSNIIYLYRYIAKNDKVLLVFSVVSLIAAAAFFYMYIYLPKLVLSKVTSNASAADMLISIGLFVALQLLVSCSLSYTGNTSMRLDKMRQQFCVKLFAKSLTCDYGYLESSLGQTRYQRAKNSLFNGRESGVVKLFDNWNWMLSDLLCFVLFSAVLSTLNILVVVLLVGTSLINYFALKAYRRYEQKNKTRWAETDKKQNYVIKTSSDYTSGKDIRLFSMRDLFINFRDMLLDKQVKNSRDKNMKALKASYVDVLIVLLRDGLSYTYLAYMTITKQISVPDFVMYFAAITQFSRFVANVIEAYHNVSSGNLSFCDTREYIEMSDPADPLDPASISDMNGDYSIDFEKVTFCYPGTTEPVLDSIDMHINKGEKIALVGINGAGKTTIVKLICGFYKPTSGVIKIGGVDIQKLKHADLTSIISTVFQDIAIFPFSIASNVSMKEKEMTEEKRVMECLELAGLKDYVCSLPEGSDTQLQRVIYDNGVIMSGGQQQKLLLARSLYKDTHILILDEPTAALDPIAEREMYEKYEMLTKNKAVLFISHRLASTRFCDRIMFMENGKITETGSHKQLVKQGGGYAKMFDIQSHYYKDNVTAEKEVS